LSHTEEDAPPEPASGVQASVTQRRRGGDERGYHLLTLSAKSEKALRELVGRYRRFLEVHSEIDLADLCFTANTGRSHFDCRLGIIACSIAELHEKLIAFLDRRETPGMLYGRAHKTEDNVPQLPSLSPENEDWQPILSKLLDLYVRGVPIDWLQFYKDYPCRKVTLPTYPFQRQRYWIETMR
jgi:acyl transferase domain-containing protein